VVEARCPRERYIGLSSAVGAMLLTVVPYSPSSRARLFVRPMTAHLLGV
jgi:hypothetical protein